MIETGMKDKLRELAAMRDALRIFERNGTVGISVVKVRKWVATLDTILDADGGAAQIGGFVTRNPAPNAAAPMVPSSPTVTLHVGACAHPAPYGVVSDEDVKTACRKYYNCGHPVYPPVFEGMRAALESYERDRK